MNLKEMSIEQLEERKAEILNEIESPEADLTALKDEARAIKEEIESRKQIEADREALRQIVAAGAGKSMKTFAPEVEEVRSTEEYCDAFKKYIITGDDTECRALTSTNATSGQVPVPVIVETAIQTAWNENQVVSLFNKTSFRGNFKAAFELSATGAYEHVEATTAPTEESLTIGIVGLIPKNIKKWITITDEAVAMGGSEFVQYIYKEITYQIIKKLEAVCIADITTASASNSSVAIGVPKLTKAPGIGLVVEAVAQLADTAANPVVVMNKLTYPEFFKAYAAGAFAVDPFAGLKVVYTSALPAYSSASTNAVYAIVGDLKAEQVNYPEGDGVIIKWDELSLAEADLVKVVGRQYAGHGITRPGCLCNIAKPAAATT